MKELKPGAVKVEYRRNGITRYDYRQPSQGEDNCKLVASELLAYLGEGYKIKQPCPTKGAKRDSKSENGADFSVENLQCGQIVEIQVTRLPDQKHYAETAKAINNNTYAEDSQNHDELFRLIECAIEEKTKKTPQADRAKRILAIDGICPSVGFNFFLTGIRFVDTQQVFGWLGVVIVAGNQNCIWLGQEDWPPCQCPKCRDPL
jgi:hypothetical protein